MFTVSYTHLDVYKRQIFDSLKEQAAAWEEQAGKTLLLDKALEYVRTPHVQHLSLIHI